MIEIDAPRLFDGEEFRDGQKLLIENGFIVDVVPFPSSGNRLIAPGFVDLQVNGGGGIMFNDETTPDGLRHIAAAHALVGTTSILPTLISGSRALMKSALEAAKTALDQGVPGIVGLHLEGPFLSPARPGIHPPDSIVPVTADDVRMLTRSFPGKLLVTLAPERVDAAMIAALAAAGVVVFAGHTDASWEQLQPGMAAGIAGFTHLFNAMSQFASRAPGAVGAVFADRDMRAGIIVDGHHSHFASVRAAHAAMGPKRLFLVSDSMATAASDTTGFRLGGKWIELRDGRLVDAAGTLGGAHLTMADALRNAVTMAGIPLGDALAMATSTPAEVIAQRGIGRIARGCRADLVALAPDLRVAQVWRGGEPISPPG